MPIALILAGMATLLATLAPAGAADVGPGQGPETGIFSVSPESFGPGDEVQLKADFPQADRDRAVTFFGRIGSGPWEEIGTSTSNPYGNAFLPHGVDETQAVFARTDGGNETEVETLEPADPAATIEGLLSFSADQVTAGDMIDVKGDFSRVRAGLAVTFYAKAGTGAFESIGTGAANTYGNAFLNDYRVDEAQEIYAATANGRTASKPVTIRVQSESEPLEVASYNVRCANCEHHSSEAKSWYDRRSSVVAAILKHTPDVIGIQEASQGWLRRDNGAGSKYSFAQFEDLRARLRDGGTPYEVTNPHRNNCEKSTTPSDCKYVDRGASKGTKIFFNTEKIELIRQGSQLLSTCSACTNERYVAWAVLEQKSTGTRFFFADTHLEPYESNYTLRNRQAREMIAEVELRNTDKLPAFVVGDLNSTNFREPDNAPFDIVVAQGFVDPLGHRHKSADVSRDATAEKRIRANFSSFNNFLRYVPRFDADQNGSNLDYIFTAPMRTLVWETVVDLDSSGKLRGVIPSDHNMIRASVLLPQG